MMRFPPSMTGLKFASCGLPMAPKYCSGECFFNCGRQLANAFCKLYYFKKWFKSDLQCCNFHRLWKPYQPLWMEKPSIWLCHSIVRFAPLCVTSVCAHRNERPFLLTSYTYHISHLHFVRCIIIISNHE